MNSDFTLSGVSVIAPGCWSVNVTPTLAILETGHSSYKGQIQMTGGKPVATDNGSEFTYTLNFTDDTSFTFCQEMIPVPEPGTFGFLAAGVLLSGGFLAG